MDELIVTYAEQAFTPEYKIEITRAFSLFNDYNLADYEQPYIDILMTYENRLPVDSQDMFTNKLNEQADFVLSEQTIFLIPDASLEDKNNFLLALFQIQGLHDYTPIGIILESTMSPEEMLATIISDYSTLDFATALSLIDKVDPNVFDSLLEFIRSKEQMDNTQANNDPDKLKIIDTLKLFTEYAEFKEAAGIMLFELGILLNQPIDRYITMTNNSYLEKDPKKLAYHILSILYLTTEGIDNPVELYRANSHLFFTDLDSVTKADVTLAWLVSQFSDYRTAHNEKNRLTQASNSK